MSSHTWTHAIIIHLSLTFLPLPSGPPALLEFTPFLGIVLGVVLVIFFVVIVIIVVFKFKKPQVNRSEEGEAAGDEFKGDLENKPAGGVVLRARPKEGTSEAEDKDPDLIPHKAGEQMK